MRLRRTLKWILVALILCVPLGAWAFYKPIRILSPQLIGLTCVRDIVCLDDTFRSSEAEALYDEALRFVDSTVHHIERLPRVVFCATDSCYRAFGLRKGAAYTTPFGIIVSPRGWQPHYIRHEMIHHLQRARYEFEVQTLAKIKGSDS